MLSSCSINSQREHQSMSTGFIDGLYIKEVAKPPRRSLSIINNPKKRPRLDAVPPTPTPTPEAATSRPAPSVPLSIEMVPAYLHDSGLFKSLGESRSLSDCDLMKMKPDLTLTSNEDFTKLIDTMHHWRLNYIPEEVIVYGLSNSAAYSNISADFRATLPILDTLCALCSITDAHDRMIAAMSSGRLEIVKYLHKSGLGSWCDAVGAAAAAFGNMECLIFAHQNGCHFGNHTKYTAISLGQVGTLQFLHKCRVQFDLNDMMDAVTYNQLECVRFLRSIHVNWGSSIQIAAQRGYLSLLKFILANGGDHKKDTSILKALQASDMSCARYLLKKKGYNLDRVEPMRLVESGSWEGLWYLLDETELELSVKVCVQLLLKRQFGLLEIATGAEGDITQEAEACLAQGSSHDHKQFVHKLRSGRQNVIGVKNAIATRGKPLLCAAQRNNVAEMTRLHTDGDTWHKDTCTVAVQWESFDALKYAHENGCPWSSAACEAAVQENRQEILQYLLDNDCPRGKNMMKLAVESWSQDMIVFLLQRGFKCGNEQLSKLAKQGHSAKLQFLVANGCAMPTDVCVHAALNGHLTCLELAHKSGGKIDQKVVLGAVQQGQLPCLLYALQNGGVMTKTLPAQAIKYKHTHILKYLHENNCPIDKKSLAVAQALSQPAPILVHDNVAPVSVGPIVYDLT